VARHDPQHVADEAAGGQLASAIVPPRLQTRSSSAAARSWSGANMTPTADSTASKLASSNGSLGVGLDQLDLQTLGPRSLVGPLQQRRDVVDAHDLAAVARRRDRGVP
jgi:hypothetical protein